jgi:hypothetical protein
MALFEEQITDTLETGAPPIKYEGDEGPQDPRQEAMLAQLKQEYMEYVFSQREIGEPVMSFEEWYQMTYEASKMGVQAPQEEMMSEQMMMREPAAYGGIMDLDSGRRAYGLGSFFKKITSIPKKLVKGVKKIAKSPVGKMGIAALLMGPAMGALGGTGAASSGFLPSGAAGGASLATKKTMGTLLKEAAKKAISNPKTLAKIGIGAASALPLLGIGTKAKQDQIEDFNQDGKFDIDYGAMRRAAAGVDMDNPSELAAFYETYGVTPGSLSLGSAEGGRIGYEEGSIVEKIKKGIGRGVAGPFTDEAIWIEKIKDFIRKKRGDPREEIIQEELEVLGNPRKPLIPEEIKQLIEGLTPGDRGLNPMHPMPKRQKPLPDMPRRRRQQYALGSKADFAIEDVMTGGMEDELGGITGIMRQADLQRKGNVGQFYAAEGGSPMMASVDDPFYRSGDEDEHSFRMFGKPYKELNADELEEFNEEMMRLMNKFSSAPDPMDEINSMMENIAMEYFGKPLRLLNEQEILQIEEMMDNYGSKPMPRPERMMAQEGGIMNLGGMEKDYRETGGFVDLGAKEKADDVPARLSVNEFVMTADAVRGAGDGDIDKGAERMEDVMKQLEQQGRRNKGAADMFEISERLSEVV